MKILITGTPGTGKTSIAGKLAKKLECKTINEKDFALKTKTGKKKDSEVEIDTIKFQKKMNEFLKKQENVIIEGHTLCEIKINADIAFVLTTERKILEKRLRKRKYNEVKIQDNLFCEETEYCTKKAEKNYKKIVIVRNQASIASALKKIIKKIKEVQ